MLVVPIAAVLAHGDESPKDDHMPTQIGAGDASLPDASRGLSREKVFLSVSSTLEQEDGRASIKFIILVLLLYTVCWLFYPVRTSRATDSEISQLPPA